MLQNGYTQLSSQQIKMAYGQDGLHKDSKEDYDAFYHETIKNENIELAFEHEIRQISGMTEQEFKRKVSEGMAMQRKCEFI